MGNKVSVHLSKEEFVDSHSVIDRAVSEHRCVACRPKPDVSNPEHDVSNPEHEWYRTLFDGRKRLRQQVVATEGLAFNVTTSKMFSRTEVRSLFTSIELDDSEPGDL